MPSLAALEELRQLGPVFRSGDAVAAGVSWWDLYALRDAVEIIELSRGLFQIADVDLEHVDFVAVCGRVPDGMICLDSALSYWDLTDEIPRKVHVAVPGGAHRPTIDYPPTQVHVFAADTFDLSSAAAGGSGVAFWSDPDCNGALDDALPITSLGPIPPFGGSACLITETRISYAAPVGATETVTSTARSQSDPSQSDTAIDAITLIVHLRTYANPLLTFPAVSFFQCSTVYAAGGGLSPGGEYRFLWSDPDLTDGPERGSPGFTADSNGRVDDRYTTLFADALGIWTVLLQRRQGSSWIDVAPYGSFTFEVVGDSAGNGSIVWLRTDRLDYNQFGDTVRVRAEVFNVFNANNFNLVTQQSAPDYGEPEEGQFRTMQFGFRVTF